MVWFSCNARQNLPYVMKSKKSQLDEIHPTFRCFCTGIKFSSWSDFSKNWLKLFRLSYGFRKCIVWYILDVWIVFKGGQSSTATDLMWVLTFDPWFTYIMTPQMQNNTFLLTILVIWLIWDNFRWNRMDLKNWPPYKRSMTFLWFWPLSQKQNIIWISCNWLFWSLWTKEEFHIRYDLIRACWLFCSIIALPPPVTPVHPIDFLVHPRGVC